MVGEIGSSLQAPQLGAFSTISPQVLGGEEHVGLDGFEELVESLQMGWDGGQRQGLNNRLVMKDLRFNQIINYEVVRGI